MEQNTSNKFLIPVAVVAAGGLIAVAIYFGTPSDRSLTARPRDTQETQDIVVAPVTDKDHIVGSRDAQLVIVEYSDTECPFCKVFHNTMKEITSTYKGKVAWVYRHFPIAQLHSKAVKEAEATECAQELGGSQIFWKYLDTLFETTQSNNSLDPSQLPVIAKNVGLDVKAFNTCLSSGKYTEFIRKNIEEAMAAGALGTPYSIILSEDGTQTIINGAEPIESVKVKIDKLLK